MALTPRKSFILRSGEIWEAGSKLLFGARNPNDLFRDFIALLKSETSPRVLSGFDLFDLEKHSSQLGSELEGKCFDVGRYHEFFFVLRDNGLAVKRCGPEFSYCALKEFDDDWYIKSGPRDLLSTAFYSELDALLMAEADGVVDGEVASGDFYWMVVTFALTVIVKTAMLRTHCDCIEFAEYVIVSAHFEGNDFAESLFALTESGRVDRNQYESIDQFRSRIQREFHCSTSS